jgi:four helix bundle protein
MHFLSIAEGSWAEVGYCIHVAHRLGYLSDSLVAELEKDVNRVGAPLAGLVRSTKADLTLSMFAIALTTIALWWFVS